MNDKYSQKLRDHAKQSATEAFKTTSKRAIQATGGLTGNKIAYKITNFSKNSQQNNSETVTSENDKEIPKERKNYQNERNTRKKGKKLLMI